MIEPRSYEELLAAYEAERSDPEWTPVYTGFPTVDTELRGISPGQVCGIAARSGVGKTFILESVEHFNAGRRNQAQLSLSLEMPGGEWAERALAIHHDIPGEQVEQWARSKRLAENLGGFLDRMRHSLVQEDSVTLGDLSAVVQAARDRLEVPLRLVLIDYMGLLGAPGTSAYERVSAVAREVKMFAKREHVAVILAMQLSRAGGTGGIPVTIDMLRDSGVAEESCDFILGCWRPGLDRSPDERMAMVAEELAELDDLMMVAVLKNRKGKAGRWVELRFHGSSRRLFEPSDPFTQLTGGMSR